MPQYVLYLHESPEDFLNVTAQQMQELVEEYHGWGEELAGKGKLVSGIKLKDEPGRVLRPQGNGEIDTADGPYRQGETIGGFFIIEASGYDEATATALTCPHLRYGGRIEVREIEPVDA